MHAWPIKHILTEQMQPFLMCNLVFASQLWQEITEENRQVQDIMSTLQNFQQHTTPTKASNHDDCETRPVHVEQRYSFAEHRVVISYLSVHNSSYMIEIS